MRALTRFILIALLAAATCCVVERQAEARGPRYYAAPYRPHYGGYYPVPVRVTYRPLYRPYRAYYPSVYPRHLYPAYNYRGFYGYGFYGYGGYGYGW